MNFLFAAIKWQRFLIIKLPFSYKMLYKQGLSFRAITGPFLSHVFSLSALILTVSTDFEVDSSSGFLGLLLL